LRPSRRRCRSRGRWRRRPSARTDGPGFRVAAAALDAAAILVFVTIGLLSHHGGVSGRGYARDALPFLGCWFAAAAVLGLYRRGGLLRLAATWAVGVPAAVLIRALVVGHALNGKELAFLVVSLVTIGAFVGALRLLWSRRGRRARP
jgi:hypothetical protein